MTDDERNPMQAELDEALAQRDAIRCELGELRAWLCRELGILRQEPGPQGMTVLSVASDKEIVAAVAQLRTDTGPSRRIWSNNSCFVESP